MVPDLVCPGCARHTDDTIDLRTLDRAGDLLVCECGRRYPIVDGVPIVLPDPAGFLRAEIAAIVERDLPLDVAALLAEVGPDDAPYPHLVEHLSIYLDAHWGDRAEPAGAFALQPLVDRLAARPRVAAAVELGCSVGRIVGELATRADRVVGLDLQFGALRRARRLLDGERVAYNRRVVGRHYTPAAAAAGDRAVPAARRTLVCSNALQPPLVPGAYDRVVACNLLDSVRDPPQLLRVIDGLCRRGGEIIVTSPYAWQSGIVDDEARLGGTDPAAAVRAAFAGYVIEDEAELAWTLRRDARSAVTYSIHYLRARKP